MPFVASTLSNDQDYITWDKPMSAGGKVARPAVPLRSVRVNGKANVANKIMTPEGVITKITDDEAEFLKNHRSFKFHEERGHVKILAREVAGDKAARDMKDRDESAPLNEAKGDFEKGGRAAGLAPKNSKIE